MDKIKGAIFSMIEAEAYRRGAQPNEEGLVFPWRRVLDLYAGSGALAIEALSRGAEHADLVERDPRARATIAANLAATGLAARANVYAMSAERFLSTATGPYDLILLDPPYADPDLERVLAALGRSPLLHAGTVLVLEHARERPPVAQIGPLRLRRTRYHGGTGISLYLASDDAAPSHDGG